MSEHLNLRPDAILKHWARAKIARSRPPPGNISAQVSAQADDDICRAIVAKFESQPAVSYAEIARTAWNQGRTRLATKVGGQHARQTAPHTDNSDTAAGLRAACGRSGAAAAQHARRQACACQGNRERRH